MKSFLKFCLQQWLSLVIMLWMCLGLWFLFFKVLKGVIIADQQLPHTNLLVGFIGGILWSAFTGGLLKRLFEDINQFKINYIDWIYSEYQNEIKPNKPSISRESLDKL